MCKSEQIKFLLSEEATTEMQVDSNGIMRQLECLKSNSFTWLYSLGLSDSQMLGSVPVGQQQSEGWPGRSPFLRSREWKPTGKSGQYSPAYHWRTVYDYSREAPGPGPPLKIE